MLLSVEEAQSTILSEIRPLNRIVERPLSQSYGEILARDIRADSDIPPFTNSAMDGYALRVDDIRDASSDEPVTLTVIGTVRAGHPGSQPVAKGQCYKIMTGGMVPDLADAVIPIESTKPGAEPNTVQILESATVGAFLRPAGEDIQKGSIVVKKGTRISPPAVGLLATAGAYVVPVREAPRVGIVSTGDELVGPDQPLTKGTIRNSNGYALQAAVYEAGGQPVLYPRAPDDPQAIRKLFHDAAKDCDLLISSGGVSVGDYDFVKPVIESLGHLTLWRVNLKPGKPVAFGKVVGIPVVGLPGNPVSALITFELFVRPAIRVMLGDEQWPRPTVRLPLAADIKSVEKRRQYLRARLVIENSHLAAWPHDRQGSAVQSSWESVDALVIVPENTGPYHAGDLLDTMLLSLHSVRPI